MVKVIENSKERCRDCEFFPSLVKRVGHGDCKKAKRHVYAMDYICELFKREVP